MKPNNNGWTDERRAKQSALIHTWKPWTRSTGAITQQGKDNSKMNAQRLTATGLLRRMELMLAYRNQAKRNGWELSSMEAVRYRTLVADIEYWLDNATMKPSKNTLTARQKNSKVNG
jgi:hypothetical protein